MGITIKEARELFDFNDGISTDIFEDFLSTFYLSDDADKWRCNTQKGWRSGEDEYVKVLEDVEVKRSPSNLLS